MAEATGKARTRPGIRRLHAVWHPHQGLWNARSGRAARKVHALAALVAVDSAILFLRAVIDRARRLGVLSIFSTPKTDLPVVVLDAGLHRNPRQIKTVVPWLKAVSANFRVLGFEAHPSYFADAGKATARFRRVRLFNVALVGPECRSRTIKLYLSAGEGLGDNILMPRGAGSATSKAIDVPAVRLSDVLTQHKIDPSKCGILLRMNIEGAEFSVLRDLAAADMLRHVDGFFGSWDDLYKLSPRKDEDFRAFKKFYRVRTIPFNDRDLRQGWPFGFRRRAIRYAFLTAIGYAGARKKRRETAGARTRDAMTPVSSQQSG